MGGSHRRLAVAVIGWLAAACSAPTPSVQPAPPASPPAVTSTGGPSPSPTTVPRATPIPVLGTELVPPPIPDAATCERLQREDRRAAAAIRSSVDLAVVGIMSGPDPIEAAATDPRATVDLIGIPLFPEEAAKFAEQGYRFDAYGPINLWVSSGRDDLFGGHWIDPPGSDRLVVAVVDGDPDTLRLARCLERPGVDVRYVVAHRDMASLRAIQDRVSNDWQELAAMGIDLQGAGVDQQANVLELEVRGLTQEGADILFERYGPHLVIEAIPAPTPKRPIRLPDLRLAIGQGGLLSQGDGRPDQPAGSWELRKGSLDETDLRLHFRIQAPPVDFPVEAGPAVLFAGMQIFGTPGGDVGMTQSIDHLEVIDLDPCAPGPDCVFEAEISLPRAAIEQGVRRLEAKGDVSWLEVEVTLVRTFAGGTWLQTLALQGGESRDGRLRDVQLLRGSIFPLGLFPAAQARIIEAGDGMWTTDFDWGAVVERHRLDIGDSSRPVATANVALHVEVRRVGCDWALGVAMHTDAGQVVVDARQFAAGQTSLDAVARIPVGTTWRVTMHDAGGIDFDRRQGWGLRVGEIRSEGEDLDVRATFDCRGPTGKVEVTGRP